MAAMGLFKCAYLTYLSQPKHERRLYKEIRQRRVKRIVEVGIGSAQRTINLVCAAQRYSRGEIITYAGLDWFEEREADQSPLPLIHAHRQLQLTGARVRLVPGFPPAALPQVANSLQRTDLLLLSSRLDDASLERAWFYMPRMCHPETLVLREKREGELARFERISVSELQRLAAAREMRRAA